jgi:ribosomal protein L34E
VPTRKRTTTAELAARLAALEARIARLEAGKAPIGDGRASVVKRGRAVKRCPGCGLPLRRRAGRCAACGRPLDSFEPGDR